MRHKKTYLKVKTNENEPMISPKFWSDMTEMSIVLMAKKYGECGK